MKLSQKTKELLEKLTPKEREEVIALAAEKLALEAAKKRAGEPSAFDRKPEKT